jgi:hypothetical protein
MNFELCGILGESSDHDRSEQEKREGEWRVVSDVFGVGAFNLGDLVE